MHNIRYPDGLSEGVCCGKGQKNAKGKGKETEESYTCHFWNSGTKKFCNSNYSIRKYYCHLNQHRKDVVERMIDPGKEDKAFVELHEETKRHVTEFDSPKMW